MARAGSWLPVCLVLAAPMAAQQSVPELEARVRRIEAENASIRAQLSALAGQSAAAAIAEPSTAESHDSDPSLADFITSGKPIRIYGFLRVDAHYNSARASDIVIPQWVLPEDTTLNGVFIGRNDDHSAIDARLTRFGLDVDAGEVADATVTGRLELDFANVISGVAESRATPRLRLGYIDLDWGTWGLRAGQDWDIVGPLHPGAENEFLLWNAGNLGDRRPQVQVRWRPDRDAAIDWEVEASAGLTGAVNNLDLDGGAKGNERDGYDFGLPQAQARAGASFDVLVPGKETTCGVWGMIAGLETDTGVGGKTHFTSWLAGVDLTLPLFEDWTLRGEHWVGQALCDHRGGIGQSINSNAGQEIGSYGGWVEVWWLATPDVRIHAGGSYDNPDRRDLTRGTVPPGRALRDLNWTSYVGTVIELGNGLKTGADVIYWETSWVDEGIGNMVRVNAFLQLDF